MKVCELINKLNQMDKERKIIIKFAIDQEDEIGYVLRPTEVYKLFNDDVVIAGSYQITKGDCDFIGQLDLKEAIEKTDKYDKVKEKLEEIKTINNQIKDDYYVRKCDYAINRLNYINNKIEEME